MAGAMSGLQPHKPQHGRALRIAALLGLGALAIVFLASRRSGGAASSGPTQADLQNAAAQAAQQQAAQDAATGGTPGTPSTFADNGAQAGALGDAVSQGLSGVADALTNQTQAINTLVGQTPAADPNAAAFGVLGGVLSQAITALGTGSKTNTGSKTPGGTKNSTHVAAGTKGPGGTVWYGTKTPTAPKGEHFEGAGGGWWKLVKNTTGNHGSGTKTSGAGSKKSGASKAKH